MIDYELSPQLITTVASVLFPLIPLSISLFVVFQLVAIYLLAIYLNHVTPLYPLSSDSGATHPEAGFFSWLVISEGFYIFIFAWLRCRQVSYVWANPQIISTRLSTTSKRVLTINRIGLKVSSITAVTMSAIGVFRSTEHMELHFLLGSFPAFISLIIYYSIQTWITIKSIAVINTLKMALFRIVLTILAFISVISFMVSLPLASFQAMTGGVTWTELRGTAKLFWDQSWSGYEAHLVSTASENLMFITICLFFASFVSEFKRIYLHNGDIKFNLGALRYSSVAPTLSSIVTT